MTIRLRRLKKDDAAGMLEWMHDPEIQKGFRMDAASKTEEDVLKFIDNALINPTEGKSVHFAISNELDEYLGTISLKNFDLVSRNAEYAICLRKSAQGQGIAFKATRELLFIAFKRFNLEKVYLNVLSDNEKAIRIYEKCGFVYEGEFRKHLFLRGEYRALKWYSILKTEFLLSEG